MANEGSQADELEDLSLKDKMQQEKIAELLGQVEMLKKKAQLVSKSKDQDIGKPQ